MKEVYIQQLLRALTPKKFINAATAGISYSASRLTGRPIVWNKPAILTVEPTNRCNLQCPQCYTGSGKINRQFANLPLATYKKIIDELKDSLIYVILFNQGEPYLHPDFLDFVVYAKSKGLYVTTSTNGHFFESKKNIEGTVSSGLDTLVISLDGTDADTYQQYRNGGSFEKVIEGIRNVVEEKKRQRRSSPKILIQFLVMRHNEHQVKDIKKLAKKLGADRVLLKTMQVDSLEDADQFLPIQEHYRRYIIANNKLKMKRRNNRPCRRLWISTVVNSDGVVVPCCFDKDSSYSFGKTTDSLSFDSIWFSKTYNTFRRKILQKHEIDICKNCTEGTKIFY